MRHIETMKQLWTGGTPRPRLWKQALFVVLAVVLSWGIQVTPAWATSLSQLPQVSPGEETWVVDDADVLSPINEGKVSKKLDQLAEKTGAEVRFVTVYRLPYDETIDSFTEQLFERWFPSPEASAHQVLVVLDTLTNDSAIQMGDQVELPPEVADSVAQDNLLLPVKKDKKYNQGVLSASNRLIAVLSGQEDPGAPQQADVSVEGTFTDAEDTDDQNATIWVIALVVVGSIIPMLTYFFYVGFPGQ
ncbi:TPM domain-containing protein [Spirulina sp. CS-785/01]|nr:TPM domain-containing protein [Spirulina sp. CS-785/01]